MAGDQRDWYRDWWRKRTGYTERASFRIGEGERKRQAHRSAWRRNWIALACLALLFTLIVIVSKILRA